MSGYSKSALENMMFEVAQQAGINLDNRRIGGLSSDDDCRAAICAANDSDKAAPKQ